MSGPCKLDSECAPTKRTPHHTAHRESHTPAQRMFKSLVICHSRTPRKRRHGVKSAQTALSHIRAFQREQEGALQRRGRSEFSGNALTITQSRLRPPSCPAHPKTRYISACHRALACTVARQGQLPAGLQVLCHSKLGSADCDDRAKTARSLAVRANASLVALVAAELVAAFSRAGPHSCRGILA